MQVVVSLPSLGVQHRVGRWADREGTGEASMQEEVHVFEALETKYPEQVVVAVSKDAHGKHNPITLG